MNFQQLEYILAVEKHKNFKRAAVECDVAQSTLSKEIQRLESEFDIIIFDRSRKPVVPTMKGLEIIKKAKEIRFHQREFIQIAQKEKHEISGQINLAIAEILAPYLAPLIIQRISSKYPKLEIKILELSDRRIEDYLIQEEVDAAVMISPALTHGYYAQEILDEELYIYSTEHDQKNGKSIDISQINLDEILMHEDMRDLMLRQIQHLGNHSSENLKNSNVKYLKGNLETLRNIIDINGGTMFIPKMALRYLKKEDQEKVIAIKNNLILKVNLVSNRGFEKKRIIRRLSKEFSLL